MSNLVYRATKPFHEWTMERYPKVSKRLGAVKSLAEREINTGLEIPVPFERRMWLWRRGFTSRAEVLYDVEADNFGQYLSEYQYELTGDIHGRWGYVFGNKLALHLLLQPFSERLPDLYGVLHTGKLKQVPSYGMAPSPWQSQPNGGDDSIKYANGGDWICRYLDEGRSLVLKPIAESGGEGVYVGRPTDKSDRYRINGNSMTREELVQFNHDLDDYLIYEFVEQANYAEELYPETVNTIRILTLWNHEADEPFIAAAIHRIGTQTSAPVDNWDKGGLSAEIGSETGILSRGVRWSASKPTRREWYECHPDTGKRIEGRLVPDWPMVRKIVLEMAAEYPYLPRIGWDLVLTDDGGVTVIEGNPNPGLQSVQVHGPLMDDPRARRFYEHYGYA